jgi:hypothetical protein
MENVTTTVGLSVLWRKTGIGEFFNHVASPRALRSVPMTTRGAPPVTLDLPPSKR